MGVEQILPAVKALMGRAEESEKFGS